MIVGTIAIEDWKVLRIINNKETSDEYVSYKLSNNTTPECQIEINENKLSDVISILSTTKKLLG